MRPNIAFDSIREIRDRLQSKPMPQVDMTREVVVQINSSSDVYVNGRKCSGKNQKIVGRFYNEVTEIGIYQQVPDISLSKRPGLDMAITGLGLIPYVRAFQRDGKVYLKRIGR